LPFCARKLEGFVQSGIAKRETPSSAALVAGRRLGERSGTEIIAERKKFSSTGSSGEDRRARNYRRSERCP